jgi:hypothetical protein
MSKLLISKNLPFSQDKNKIKLMAEFCNFCADYLPIIDEFEIQVIDDRNSHGVTTTAAYHIGENKCVVYGKNRAFVDVLRSIAHEMTHMMQDELGLIGENPIRDAGGFHEDQANARAGELIKRFAKSSTDRKQIYENKSF